MKTEEKEIQKTEQEILVSFSKSEAQSLIKIIDLAVKKEGLLIAGVSHSLAHRIQTAITASANEPEANKK
jgi:mRNA degradation ribonuclease J1/J2